MTEEACADASTLLDATGEARLYQALRQEWLPVAYAGDISDQPVAVTLLGEELLVTRFADRLSAFADLCPHRGARLSLGWRRGATLQCAYHGWAFGADGRCVDIPAVPLGRIPQRARLHPFPAAEAAGLVWVRLDEPVGQSDDGPPLSGYLEADDPAYRLVEVPAYDWACSVHRRIENFVDLAHLPWVHDQVLGNRAAPLTPEHHVERTGRRITMTSRVPEQINAKTSRAIDGIDGAGPAASEAIVTVQDWLIVAPVTLWWRQELGGGRHFGVLLAASPLDALRCRTFTVLFRDFATTPADDADILRFHLEVAEADRPVVESQRPHQLQVDLTAELHLRDTDRMSVEYRRALVHLAGRRARSDPDPSARAEDGAVVSAGVGG